MKLGLNDSVSLISGIGPRYLGYLEKLNIKTIKDLLWYFPFRYDDYSNVKNISELEAGQIATVIAEVLSIKNRRSFKRRMFITEAKVKDESGEALVTWFNQPYLTKNIPIGSYVSLSGKLSFQGKKLVFISPAYEVINQSGKNLSLRNFKHTGRLVPVYPETSGLTSRALRFFIRSVLSLANNIEDPLPLAIRQRLNLLDVKKALWQIHYPDSLENANSARDRFIFEELLMIQLYILKLKRENLALSAPDIKSDVPIIQTLVKNLPYTLTNDQKKAIWKIMQDMESGKPMNRLLEGDVGSGKTIVALSAALLAHNSGYQSVILAPTEILAKQHFLRFKEILQNFNVKIALITASQSEIAEGEIFGKVPKEVIIKNLSLAMPLIVIGTHALIQKNVKFSNLGLVIVDEQHRFGVNQRSILTSGDSDESSKISGRQLMPHFLSMTATPIPRTLALSLYGNLELSILREMPIGRKKIITQVVPPRNQKQAFQLIREEIEKGRQAFVICPRIEESEKKPGMAHDLITWAEKLAYDVKAVKKEYKKLKEEIFPDLRIGMLHGKMKALDKTKMMRDFVSGEIDVLVSTSVVEVGIDVPNASIILIEGADRFGLSQLHQFRGRVGRGSEQSYCFLLSESSSFSTLERLKAMASCDDGFALAEKDLEIRGPGEFLGTRQSGIPDLAMAGLKDVKKIEMAQAEAKRLMEKDLSLKNYPLLAQKLCEMQGKLSVD